MREYQGLTGGTLNPGGSDRKVFQKLTTFLDKNKSLAKCPDQLILAIGEFFLGSPYVAGALETKGDERLLVNLREHDCVSFVENVVALVWQAKSLKKSFGVFRRTLRKIRYRQGQLRGYASRLHYFSDWICDNQKKGFVRDVTAEIGGSPLRKTMSFMTTHPDFYPPLKDPVNFRRMKSVERTLSRRSLFFLPKEVVRQVEGRIRDGDLIAVTTNKEGLDVQHVGLAATVKKRIHLLHASSIEGKVVLSEKTLYRYLMQSRTRSGIMVARMVMAQDA